MTIRTMSDTASHRYAASSSHTQRRCVTVCCPIESANANMCRRLADMDCVCIIALGEISSVAYWVLSPTIRFPCRSTCPFAEIRLIRCESKLQCNDGCSRTTTLSTYSMPPTTDQRQQYFFFKIFRNFAPVQFKFDWAPLKWLKFSLNLNISMRCLHNLIELQWTYERFMFLST